MDNQEVLKAIAVLADKVSRYHERLLALERDHKRHTDGCSCQEKPKEIAKGPSYPSIGRPLTISLPISFDSCTFLNVIV